MPSEHPIPSLTTVRLCRAPQKSWVCVWGLGWVLLYPIFRRAESKDVPQALLSPLPPAEVLVLARYRAQTEDELSLAPGDVIQQVCAGPARGWLLGELRGRRGLFPKRLVQVSPGVGKAARGSKSGPGLSLRPCAECRPHVIFPGDSGGPAGRHRVQTALSAPSR